VYCPWAEAAIDQLIEEYGTDNVVYIAYHYTDELEIAEGSARWASYYGNEGTPNMYFDGLQNVLGGWEGCYDAYLAELQSRWANSSPIRLELIGGIVDTEGYISANVTLEGDIPAGMTVRFAVIENDIILNRHYNGVLRDLLAEETLSISQQGETVTLDRTFPVEEGWNYENMGVVVFVQNDNTHEVLQAAYFDASDSEYLVSFTSSGTVAISEADQPYDFYALVENVGPNDDTYTITMNTDELPEGWNATFTIGEDVYESEAEIDLASGEQVLLTINYNPNNVPGQGDVYLELVSHAEPRLQKSMSFRLISDVEVLIVDDALNTDATLYETVLTEDETIWGTWEVLRGGNIDSDEIANIPTVLWITGSDDRETITEDDQMELITYLENGGSLLLTGHNIGGDIAATEFYTDFLGARYRFNNFGQTTLNGIEGNPIGDGLVLEIEHDSPDVVMMQDDVDGLEPVFQYGAVPNLYAALAHAADTYRTVYFSVSLDQVSDPDSRESALLRSLRWLRGESTNIDPVEQTSIATVSHYQLAQNVPNPFNPRTTIAYALPEQSRVSIHIYNSSGQLIRTLVNKTQNAGTYHVQWDGTDSEHHEVASGIYLYKLVTDKETHIKSMVLLR